MTNANFGRLCLQMDIKNTYNMSHIMRDAWRRYRETIKWAGMRFDREKFALALSLAWKTQKTARDPVAIAADAARPSVSPAMDRMFS